MAEPRALERAGHFQHSVEGNATAEKPSDAADLGEERITFGKHAGKAFSQVAHDEPGYCRWTQSIQNPTGHMLKFVEYLRLAYSSQTEVKRAFQAVGGQPEELASKRIMLEPPSAQAPASASRWGRPLQPLVGQPEEAASKRVIPGTSSAQASAGAVPLASAWLLTAPSRTFRLQRKYLDLIKSGRKRWEGRLKVGAASGIPIGCNVTFTCGGADLKMKVRSLREYKSFADMLRDLGVENCLPGVVSLEQAVAIYHSFPGYAEKEIRFGVLAMELMHPGACFTLGM